MYFENFIGAVVLAGLTVWIIVCVVTSGVHTADKAIDHQINRFTNSTTVSSLNR